MGKMFRSYGEDDRTRLRATVDKWLDIAFLGKVDRGRLDCPLCEKYFDRGCSGCLIPLKCNLVSMTQWRISTDQRREARKVHDEKSFEAAIGVIRYLIHLLPFESEIKQRNLELDRLMKIRRLYQPEYKGTNQDQTPNVAISDSAKTRETKSNWLLFVQGEDKKTHDFLEVECATESEALASGAHLPSPYEYKQPVSIEVYKLIGVLTVGRPVFIRQE